MATASDISVAVESAIHGVLTEVAKNVWKQHGIVIESVNFGWTEASSLGEKRLMILTSVNVESTTKP